MTMEERILHIQLMNGLGMRDRNAEDSPDSCWLHNRTEGPLVVDVVLLSKSPNHPMGLVASKSPIGVEFLPKYPLLGHHIDTWRSRKKLSHPIVHKSMILISHGSSPIGIHKSTGTGEADELVVDRFMGWTCQRDLVFDCVVMGWIGRG